MDIGHDLRHYSGTSSTSTTTSLTYLPPTSDTINTTNNNALKKRRASNAATTSRGVANLTPEQLAKKRANDREAQRAIRERTKGQIEKLEREIQELRGQQPYQELQNAIRQRELVEAENKDIKTRLVAISNLIQPLVGQTDLAQIPHRDPALPGPIVTAGLSTGSQAQGFGAPRSATSSSTYACSPHANHTPPSIPQQASYLSQPNAFPPVSVLDQRQRSHANSLQSSRPEEKLDLGYLINTRQDGRNGHEQYSDGRPPNASLPMHTLSPYQSVSDVFSGAVPVCALPPRHVSATCPLDGLLLDFLAERRQQAEKGASTMDLIGPAYPSVVTLLDPSRGLTSHPLSKVFTDMLSKFPDISTLPEQVAVVYIMFLLMRWQISPTTTTHARLPTWITPTPSQLTTPHPAWIDHLPWPRMRDTLVSVYPSIPFDDFFIPYTTTLSLNWPYEARDVLLTIPGSEELGINPVFERHLRDLGNWTLGSSFAKAHPVLADTVSVRDGWRGERRRAEGTYN
ncbi:hypothetical protein MMC21_000113 [Puttea exsequens]|nr:hypothetical protein [Puttea exsequens]